MKKVIYICAATIAIGGCASSGPSFKNVVTAAEREIMIAENMKYLWRDTKKILEDAKKAKEEGDDKEAMKLAREALAQAKLAQQQARDQANPKTVFPK